MFPLSLNFHPIIKQRIKEFNGNNIFDVVKSRKSKIDLPIIDTSLSFPNESAAGIDISEIKINKIVQALILETLHFSIRVAHGASRILIPEVTAAQNKRTKNANEIILPNGS